MYREHVCTKKFEVYAPGGWDFIILLDISHLIKKLFRGCALWTRGKKIQYGIQLVCKYFCCERSLHESDV